MSSRSRKSEGCRAESTGHPRAIPKKLYRSRATVESFIGYGGHTESERGANVPNDQGGRMAYAGEDGAS